MEYINSLFNSKTTTATKYSIRSYAHNLTVQKQDKLALNLFDDKRLYLNPIQYKVYHGINTPRKAIVLVYSVCN